MFNNIFVLYLLKIYISDTNDTYVGINRTILLSRTNDVVRATCNCSFIFCVQIHFFHLTI